ncbi:hypothetical protein WN55_04275 [Dufourea novaeangliae]|uniref:CCDC66 domain-containing protein n=1 Tax=Dufourea novaeangliae TaxID=178035 RepID=A0A154PMR8_DUFNO|nr:hypothetical protein WN55_04275 [Dufourea novaeangliae]
MPLAETKDKSSKPFRASGHYGSTVSLKSLAAESSGNSVTSLKCLDCNGGSLINLHEQPDVSQIRHRSPSLPPIYSKDQQQYLSQSQQRDYGVDGLCYQSEKLQRKHDHRSYDRDENSEKNHYGSQSEEREGETSGYASDSVDVPVLSTGTLLPGCKPPGGNMIEKTWQNPYYNTTPESSLPPSRRLSDGRIGELRPRWGSVWGQEMTRGDPPAPSWLSRLGHSSQVLVINHESASSSDSSTVGTIGSDNTKTYLRGQNIHVDADILQEREARRQKALVLQDAIKKQLEEKGRQRKEEKERKLREERLEEERIEREREKEKERLEEEQQRLKEREAAKFRQAETMREVIEAAERLAKEQKRKCRKREETDEETAVTSSRNCESIISNASQSNQNCPSERTRQNLTFNANTQHTEKEKEISSERESNDEKKILNVSEKTLADTNETTAIQVPISKDVAIVLSGRLEDSELLNNANLQLVNLVLTPTPRKLENNSSNLAVGLNSFVHNMGSINFTSTQSRIPSTIVENRLLTPSKYRLTNGRDFGTQTDVENDFHDSREDLQDMTLKNVSMKDRKDATNASKRDIENSTNVGSSEVPVKTFLRSKSQPRTSINSRPQWNANRPGTRYRTQSEKDPHYQRRLRMRRRQVESSDERSRSPSPDRRKLINVKSKIRTTNRRKVKVDSYDADLSMDSLNSIIPLRIDKNGRIAIEDNRLEQMDKARSMNGRVDDADNVRQSENENSNVWCGQEILSKLSTLKNVCVM